MMFGTREVFSYRECSLCRSLYLAELPADLGSWYREGYYALEALRQEPSLKRWVKRRIAAHVLGGGDAIGNALHRILAEPMLVRIARFARAGFSDRILDVGSGEGADLTGLESLGFCDLTGVDPYIRECRTIGRNIRLLKQGLEGVDETFDLIMFNHSLEHVPAPGSVLRQAVERLTSKGRILIRIPVAATEGWEIYGTDWVQLDAPRHVHIPSVEGMERLASGTGIELVDLSFDSYGFMYWGSELYQRDVSLTKAQKDGGPAAYFPKAALREFERRAEVCNRNGRGDQAAFLLRKK